MFPQTVLDIPKLHPETTDLDQVVCPSKEADVSIGKVRSTVTGLIHACAWLLSERIANESFRSQRWLVDITEAQAFATYIKVALYSDPTGLQIRVENVIPGIVDWPAVRDAVPLGIYFTDGIIIRPDRRFRRSSQADELNIRKYGSECAGQAQRRIVAAEKHQAQILSSRMIAVLRKQGHKLVECRGGRVPECDWLADEHIEQQLRVFLFFFISNIESGASSQEAKEVEYREIKSQRRYCQSDIRSVEVEGPVTPVQQIVDRSMGNGDPLWFASTSRGEDHVSRVAR